MPQRAKDSRRLRCRALAASLWTLPACARKESRAWRPQRSEAVTWMSRPALAKDGDKRWELSSSAFGKIVIWFFSLLLAFAAIGYWQNMGRK